MIIPRVKLKWYQFPTLFLFRQDDQFIKGLALTGIVLSIICFLGIVPALCLAGLWLLYLSFLAVGDPFLRFQWDALLVEVGFFAIFFAIMSPPPMLLVVALYLMTFRLLFASGTVKCTSGCPQWKAWQALKYHFETQPLPNLGGYLAHHAPKSLLKFSTFLTLFLEIVPPFLFFGNGVLRMFGGLLSLFLQFLIAITGNFAFFNLLTIAMLISLFDNRYINWLDGPLVTFQSIHDNFSLALLLNLVGGAFAAIQLMASLKQFLQLRSFNFILEPLERLEIISYYGLFAVMTCERIEIFFEGTLDRKNWIEYPFKYKPQALDQCPKQIAPLQPRLDWQLWFVPLSPRHEWWVGLLMERLLEGSKEVLKLFKEDPFHGQKPVDIRVKYYRYTFTSFEEFNKEKNYWKREKI